MNKELNLNSLSPAPGSKSKRKRVGRGIGSGYGKTCGRGHKGQKSRTGSSVRPGFEGGQMPLQKRLPKYGFTSRVALVSAQIRTSELEALDTSLLEDNIVDLFTLRRVGLIGQHILRVKVFLSGDINKALHIKGLSVSKGARLAIEKAGGTIEG